MAVAGLLAEVLLEVPRGEQRGGADVGRARGVGSPLAPLAGNHAPAGLDGGAAREAGLDEVEVGRHGAVAPPGFSVEEFEEGAGVLPMGVAPPPHTGRV